MRVDRGSKKESRRTVHDPCQVVLRWVVDRPVREQALPRRRPRELRVVADDLQAQWEVRLEEKCLGTSREKRTLIADAV